MSTLVPSSTPRLAHVTRISGIPLGVSIAGYTVEDGLQHTSRHAVFPSANDTFGLEGQRRAVWGVLRELAINGFLTGAKNNGADMSTVSFSYMGYARPVEVPTVVAEVLSFDSFDEVNEPELVDDFVLRLLVEYCGVFVAFR